MRRRIEVSLARLASRGYQRRFISEATSDEYVLPDEMLDSAASLLEATLNSKTLSRSLNEAERRCLEEALAQFRDLQKRIRFDDPEFSAERDENWLVVRQVADNCLSVLRFDLERWETENTGEKGDHQQG